MRPVDARTLAVLNPSERMRLLRIRRRDPFVEDVLAQLTKILESETFSRVQDTAKNFLTFVVARTLLGRQRQVKQVTIAMVVFGESAEFNPLETSRIRVAGSLLRKRIAHYFRCEGSDDPIAITIPRGTYVPDIRDRRTTIHVEELANWGGKNDRRLGAVMTDEIARALQEKPRFSVARTHASAGSAAYRLRGSVGIVDAILRLSISVLNMETARIAYWQTFDVAKPNALTLPTVIATSIVGALSKKKESE